jgi:hypothetical protein
MQDIMRLGMLRQLTKSANSKPSEKDTSDFLTKLLKMKVSSNLLSQKTESWQFLVAQWSILVCKLIVVDWIER